MKYLIFAMNYDDYTLYSELKFVGAESCELAHLKLKSKIHNNRIFQLTETLLSDNAGVIVNPKGEMKGK